MGKTIFGISLLAALALMLLATDKAESAPINLDVDVSVGYFYSSLRPYGEWIEIDAGYYGWRPTRVRAGWRPYLYGRWAWTDYGWYWMSTEPFGWAVFHYGRWYFDDYYGWIWIPDRVWGPAWVEWRYNDDYLGWAPLPPYASFSFSIGIRFTRRWVAPVSYWTFVRYRHFGTSYVDRYAAPPDYTRRLIGVTRTSTRYEVDRDRIINRGVDRTTIERQGNTRIDRYDVTQGRERGERIVRDGGRERIEVYRPDTDPTTERNVRVEARRPERRLSLEVDRIDRGSAERQTHIRGSDGRETRGTRSDTQTGTPGRDINRDQGTSRDRSVEPNERQSIKEHLEQRRQDFERPKERSREEWFAPSRERRETMRERPVSRERVAPPQSRKEAPRPTPEVRRGGERKQGGSRSEGSKRNR